jgi:CSLREA domain-containing protein
MKKILLTLSIAALSAPTLWATSITVNTLADVVADDGVCGLREAVENSYTQSQNGRTSLGECAAGSGSDTIVLPAGVLVLGSDLNIGTSTSITLSGTGKNSTEIDGGLDANGGDLQISDLKVMGAESGVSAAIAALGAHFTATRCEIVATGSYGIFGSSNPIDLVDCTVSNASNTGLISTSTGASVTVTRSTFKNNNFGIRVSNGNLALFNSTFYSNASFAAVFQNATNGTVDHCTFSNNAGTGIYVLGTGALVHLARSIIFGGITDLKVSAHLVSDGHNIYGTLNNTGTFDTDPSDLASTDPMIQPLADNGGFTETCMLDNASPAYNFVPSGYPATDQRGVSRPIGLAAEAGAWEGSPAAPTHTPTGTPTEVPYFASPPPTPTVSPTPAAPAQFAPLSRLVSNGTVYAMTASASAIYLAGNFSYLGPFTGSGVVGDPATGALQPGFPVFEGAVNMAVGDGFGGWFVGGAFSKVAGLTRPYLVHVFSNGSLDPNFSPAPDNAVLALVLSGNVLYVAGYFNTIGGLSRPGLAKLSATSGAADPVFNAAPSGGVAALALNGGDLFAGGEFFAIGGQNNGYLAKLNAATGDADPAFNLSLGQGVSVLAVSGGALYLGGNFPTVGGQARPSMAKVDAGDGTVDLAFDASPDAPPKKFLFSGGDLYVGGYFSNIGGRARLGLAKLDAATGGADPSFDAALDGAAVDLALNGSSLYLAGSFGVVGGQACRYLTKVDVSSGIRDPSFHANASTYGNTVALSGGLPFFGGNFNSVGGGTGQRYLAKLDLSGNVDPSFNVSVDGMVKALALAGSSLIIGGEGFNQVNGVSRIHIAKLDVNTGALDLSFDPNANPSGVRALAFANGSVYAAGGFYNIGGLARHGIAKLDLSTGAADPAFTTVADNWVYALQAQGGSLYLGGSFSTIGGLTRNGAAKLDPATGTVDPSFNPNVGPSGSSSILALAVDGGSAYLGGYFSTVGGQSKNDLAKVDAGTGALASSFPGTDNNVDCLYSASGSLYLGGNFSAVAGQGRMRLAKLDEASGTLDPAFNPGAYDTVWALMVDPGGTELHVGGDFDTLANRPLPRYGVLNLSVPNSPTPSPSATLSPTPTLSPSRTPSPSASPTPSASPSFSVTATPSASPSASPSETWTATMTPSASSTATVLITASPTPSATLTATATETQDPTPGGAVTPIATATPINVVQPANGPAIILPDDLSSKSVDTLVRTFSKDPEQALAAVTSKDGSMAILYFRQPIAKASTLLLLDSSNWGVSHIEVPAGSQSIELSTAGLAPGTYRLVGMLLLQDGTLMNVDEALVIRRHP